MVKKRLGEMLLEAGVIDEHNLQAALGHQRRWGGRLGQALVDLKLATESQIVSALSQKFGYQTVPPDAFESGPMLEATLKLVPREFASRHNLIPFAMEPSTIWVAMSDPANIAVVDEIRFRTGRRVQIALAGDREIAEAVRRHYFADQDSQFVNPIALEIDVDATSETVVEHFGDGSAAAFEGFFSRPPESTPLAAPEPGAAPVPFPSSLDSAAAATSASPREQPAAGGEDVSLPAINLQDILTEEIPAPGAWESFTQPTKMEPVKESNALATREDSISIELPLEVVDPEPPSPSQHRALEVLACWARGDLGSSATMKPEQMMAALVRLLLRKKIISDEEFFAEIDRK